MTEELHERRCERCIRRMNVGEVYIDGGNISYDAGTMDCPTYISAIDDIEIVEAISILGCCSFENGISSVEECRFREGEGDFAGCGCHNTRIVFATCLSKRNHGCCPYELKGDEDENSNFGSKGL